MELSDVVIGLRSAVGGAFRARPSKVVAEPFEGVLNSTVPPRLILPGNSTGFALTPSWRLITCYGNRTEVNWSPREHSQPLLIDSVSVRIRRSGIRSVGLISPQLPTRANSPFGLL